MTNKTKNDGITSTYGNIFVWCIIVSSTNHQSHLTPHCVHPKLYTWGRTEPVSWVASYLCKLFDLIIPKCEGLNVGKRKWHPMNMLTVVVMATCKTTTVVVTSNTTAPLDYKYQCMYDVSMWFLCITIHN